MHVMMYPLRCICIPVFTDQSQVDNNGYGSHPFYLNLEPNYNNGSPPQAHGVLLLNSNAGGQCSLCSLSLYVYASVFVSLSPSLCLYFCLPSLHLYASVIVSLSLSSSLCLCSCLLLSSSLCLCSFLPISVHLYASVLVSLFLSISMPLFFVSLSLSISMPLFLSPSLSLFLCLPCP